MKKNMFLIIIILTSINLFGQNPPLYPRAWVNGEIITHYNDDKSVMINNEIKLLENQIPELIVITEKADTIFKYCVKNKITTEFERSLGSIEMFDTFNGHYRIIFIFKYDVDDYENKCDNYRANAIIIANVESSKGNKSHYLGCQRNYVKKIIDIINANELNMVMCLLIIILLMY